MEAASIVICACGGALLGLGERGAGIFVLCIGAVLTLLDAAEKGLL